MPITLSKTSTARLDGVDARLVRVVRRAAAIATPEEDFTVVQGKRSREDMMVNYGKGRTVATLAKWGIPASYAKPKEAKVTWLANPFKSKHGDGLAVDLAPWPIDWTDLPRFKRLADLVKRAAALEGVAIVWGGDWVSSKDYPHFELVS